MNQIKSLDLLNYRVLEDIAKKYASPAVQYG